MQSRVIEVLRYGLAGLALLGSLPLRAGEIDAALLVYRIETPDGESSVNRLLTTRDYLRLDQGAQDPGFILFDRKQRKIYSVTPSDRSILVIDPPAGDPQKPDDLAIEVRRGADGDLPLVEGVKPQHWTLLANGNSCREADVAPGVMADAVGIYADYLRVLAAQQALALPSIPEEFRDACDSAIHVYAPDALLRKGLPVKVWDGQGYREALVDFRPVFSIPDDSFTLPTGFQETRMGAGS
ncbi:MAG: UDP-2,3-diacylglucosamine hydrolase [Candidatus Thiodiazotropha sp.]